MRLMALCLALLTAAPVHAADAPHPVSDRAWILGILGGAVAIGGGVALGIGIDARSRAMTDEEIGSATNTYTGGALLLGTAVCLLSLSVIAWLWNETPQPLTLLTTQWSHLVGGAFP